MFRKKDQCIDAGMQHCPCSLAEFDQCITCSRLMGLEQCDCEWQGICVYNEYLQNGKRVNSQREEHSYKILQKKWFGKDLAVIRLEVPRGLAQRASLPGSCVFARAEGCQPVFDVPLSVLHADSQAGFIELAIKASGVKTGNLLGAEQTVRLRGIYENGLLGREKLFRKKAQKVLCLTKGVGLSPAANYCRWAEGKDCVDFRIDLEKISREFAEECLKDCITGSVEYESLSEREEKYENYDVVLLSASDYYQESLNIPAQKRVISNNQTMCCGEGICGACAYTDKNGGCHKLCKCNKKIE